MQRKLPDDFEVRHIHRELNQGRRQTDTIHDESGLQIGEAQRPLKLEPENIGGDPRNYRGRNL